VKVSLSESGLEDLESIKKYYLDLGVPKIGENFVIAIFEHIETLTEHPDIDRIFPEFNEEHIRELIHPPFRVVYLRGRSLIQVTSVWRSERLLSLSSKPGQF
jgi:toxin ParE1/3/4